MRDDHDRYPYERPAPARQGDYQREYDAGYGAGYPAGQEYGDQQQWRTSPLDYGAPDYPADGYPPSPPPAWPGPQERGYPQAPAPARVRTAVAQEPAPRVVYRDRPAQAHHRRLLPRFHIAHIILFAGVALLAVALTRAWGTAADGTEIFVRSFTLPRLGGNARQVGAAAMRTATTLVAAVGVLALALFLVNGIVTLLNKIIGIIGLSGLASILFFPVLWGVALLMFAALALAAGFGGLGALSQLPIVQSHGFAEIAVKSPALGYYLWWAGIGAAFIGTLGELLMKRR